MKPLIWKELRENVRWLPLGWVIVTFACLTSLPSRSYIDSGLSARLVGSLALVAPLMAFSLGLLQSVRDTQPAAGAYLQHRCLSQRQIFWSKMIAALVIYLVVIVMPLLLFAGWIQLRGLEKYPMRPIEVLPALACSMLAFPLHPATLIMMTRSALWWGTRWFPLVFPIVITGVASLTADRYASMMSMSIGFFAVFVVVWLSLTAISYWQDNGTRMNRLLRFTYLSLCNAIIVSFGVHLIMAFAGQTELRSDKTYNVFELETTTQVPWFLTIQFYEDEATHKQKVRVLSGAPVDGSPIIDPTMPIPGEAEFTEFGWGYLHTSDSKSFPRDRFIRSAGEFERSKLEYFYDDRGYLLGYQQKPRVRWVQTIAADGVYPSGELVGKPFTRNPTNGFRSFHDAGYPRPLIDSNGVYLVDDDSGAIRTLIEGPIDGHDVTDPKDGSTPRILILSQGVLSEYRFVDASGSEGWYEAPPDGMKFEKLQSLAGHGLFAERVQSVSLPAALLDLEYFAVVSTDSGFVAVEDDWSRSLFHLFTDEPSELIEFSLAPGTSIPRGTDQFYPEIALCGLLPGSISLVIAAWNYKFSNDGFSAGYALQSAWLNPFQTTVVLGVFAFTCLVAIVLIVMFASRYELSRRTAFGWCLSVPALGLAAPLAILAIYDRPRRESCPACDKSRRIDEATCENCGAAWEAPASEGIEIVDRAA